jgi:cytochrome c oxidase subunit II
MPLTRRSFRRFASAALTSAFLALCAPSCTRTEYPQSAMNPEADYARMIQKLFDQQVFWVVIIFAFVQLLLLVAVIRFRSRPGQPEPKPVHGNTVLEVAWTVAPAVILALVAIPTVATIYKTQAEYPPGAMIVKAIGHQWWWEFKYPGLDVVTADEMHIPAAKPIIVEIESADVIHSFWIPAMGGKRDAVPNHTNRIWFTADHPGEYPGECAEFCGTSHANMKMKLFVQTQADFDQWVTLQRSPAPMPDSMSLAGKGRELFAGGACIACHTIQGVSQGIIGPNLTHVGGRTTFAGSLFTNDPEHLSKWIANAPAQKPGVIMPALGLPPDQVTAIVAYLESLK